VNISFETEYNQEAMIVMARALRKTIGRKRSRYVYIFGWAVVILVPLLSYWFAIKWEFKTFILIAIMIALLIWEDTIEGYLALKRLIPGTEKAHAVFGDSEFISSTDIGTSTFYYDKIKFLAENEDYFVFIYSISHAQVYDKNKISGGTLEEFRDFIERATGKQLLKV